MYLALPILLDFQNPDVKLLTEVTYAWVAFCWYFFFVADASHIVMFNLMLV